jgi:hypothetical protein
MTTKVLSGNYTGYHLQSPVTFLSVTSTGSVGGHGIYTESDPPNTYTVANDGKLNGSI